MGGTAWGFGPAAGQYYQHAFLREQEDRNWSNPEVVAAMGNVLRFWFDRGVDGFRIDVLWHCIKAEALPDNPLNPDFRPGMGEKLAVLQHHSADQPEVHGIAHGFRRLADSYGERLLVGEICLPLERQVAYYGTDEAPGVHLPFNFQLFDAPWDAAVLARIIADYEAALPPGGWPNWVLGSHDSPRLAGRLGEAQARVAAMLLLTLRGTPTLYQGDELGIGKVTIPPDRIRDPQNLRQPGLGLGRDGPARRCPGMPVPTPASAQSSPGCRSTTTGRPAMTPSRTRTLLRCSTSIAHCFGCGAAIPPWRSATSPCCRRSPTCSSTCGARTTRPCWSRSISAAGRAAWTCRRAWPFTNACSRRSEALAKPARWPPAKGR